MAVGAAPRKVHIAVLECLRLGKAISDSRGQFGDVFRAWLLTSVAHYNATRSLADQLDVTVTSWDVEHGQYPPALETVDAVIVTGSTASAYDEDEWIVRLSGYLRDIYNNEPGVRIFGGCFGHQLLAQSLLTPALKVEKSPNGWEIGVHAVNLTEDFKKDFPRLNGVSAISCQFLHADHVTPNEDTLPKGWVNVGASKLCGMQGLYYPGRVLTFQGHPEFDAFLNAEGVKALGVSKTLSPEQVEESLEMVDRKDDSMLYGEIFLDFISHGTTSN